MSAVSEPFDAAQFLRTLSSGPGVYRMLNAAGEVLYVGKARNLKRRVASYFRTQHSNRKTQRLVEQIQQIEVTLTHTEVEALLLENTLIKHHQPRYNVLLRDGKGYPYLLLSDHAYPRLTVVRGARTHAGQYFGPYPHTQAVQDTQQLLSQLFRLRTCEDQVLKQRSRPCLEYQIKRCSAPCVGLISAQDYQRDVQAVEWFLSGRSQELIATWVQRMEHAAQALQFEQAAHLRDQIAQLRQVQARQHVEGERGDLDVLWLQVQNGLACVEVLFFRGGRLLGNKAFFPRLPHDWSEHSLEVSTGAEAAHADWLSSFLLQFYSQHGDIPHEILLGQRLRDSASIAQALSSLAGRKVQLHTQARGQRVRWLEMARQNAEQAVREQLSTRRSQAQRWRELMQLLELPAPHGRIECFDISHTQGEATVASCVVFDAQGPCKSAYRRFNISGITPGDDYAAMQQALERRYSGLIREQAQLPQVLVIDGGAGQLQRGQQVLQSLGLQSQIALLGIAKGPSRKAGLEVLHLSSTGGTLILPKDSAALHLLQHIRDEAHRFAITGHRQRRAQARQHSRLEDIPGVGVKRRQALLKQFGGLQGLTRAGVEDLAQVPGINKELAQRIYDALHGAG